MRLDPQVILDDDIGDTIEFMMLEMAKHIEQLEARIEALEKQEDVGDEPA